jgi:trk system potassium uptake protein TrkA
MYIVIIGCGKLGSTIARELSSKGNDVVIIDNDSDNLNRLGTGFNGIRIAGVEFDNDILLEAGIDKADVFIGVTSDDNTNIMASQIARDIFSVPKVMARICEPNKEFIYKKLGIETINPVNLSFEMIRNKITEKSSRIISVLDNNMEIVEMPIKKEKIKDIKSIEKEYGCRISSILRDGKFKLADADDNLQSGDKIVCVIDKKDRQRLSSALSGEVFV